MIAKTTQVAVALFEKYLWVRKSFDKILEWQNCNN